MNGAKKKVFGKPSSDGVPQHCNEGLAYVKTQLNMHELSVEQQRYFVSITEACLGTKEPERMCALKLLASDPGVHELLPKLSTFIKNGVKVNVVYTRLSVLIYLMRMMHAILQNESLYIQIYLHELLPSAITCIVCKQLCEFPESDNHWVLRKFSAKMVASICRKYTNSSNEIQPRVIRILTNAMHNNQSTLPTLYGVIAGLVHIGPEVVCEYLIPNLKLISARIEPIIQSRSELMKEDKLAATQIKGILQKWCPPVLEKMRPPPDDQEDYRKAYGFIGPTLCSVVICLRSSTPSNGPTALNLPNTLRKAEAPTSFVVWKPTVKKAP